MEELRKLLDVQDGGKDWTLISDQQKGLVNVVSLIWKNTEHRNCARHIYANWKKKFKGKVLKMYYWQACGAYNEPDFNDAIKGMRDISTDAVEAFMKQNPNCFVRCFLKNNTSFDLIVSNMAETFNGTIVELKIWLCAQGYTKKLDRGKKWAHKCTVFPSAYNVFQVKDFDEDLAVDLNSKTCSCRKWDLIGIPCKHVCSVAGFLGRNVELFVDECYLKETYLRT
ncbi:uncharacterized protein LOC143629667 [Bidens hawaiensis]|uniref:uncharacterized protein LOC143629667 n=1 Tax=Bidens hawaiensis TaxID=980011 RepID=UPI00404AC251